MDKICARLGAIVALVAVVFSLRSAPAGAQAVPKQLRIAVGIDADTLDPAGQTTTTVANMVDYFFETLVDMDYAKNEVVPRLATQWQTSRDGLTYTFQLRRGVVFHDGTPMTAAAVKSTFDRLLDPKTKVPLRGALLAGIKSVDVVDDTTVRFTMSKPNPLLLRNLTYTTNAIISPAALARAGDRFGLAPVGAGTGPYTFKEWRRGESILVERTPSYWGKKPLFEEVLFQVVPDAGTRETMVLAGNVHLAMLPPAPDIKNLRKNPQVTLVEAPTDRVIFLAMNNQWGPFKDVRVRQAMNYAINKKALLTSILFDLGTVEASACPAMMFGHSPMQEGGWPYNPAKAKQLLAEAGYKDGFDVEFLAPTGRYIQDFQFAQGAAAQLRNVNIRATVSTMDWPTYIANITQPVERSRTQLFILGWAWVVLDCDGVLFGQFHSSQQPPAGLASAFYKNEKVDDLLVKARTTVDVAQRATLYKDAQTQIWNDAPWVFLWSQKWYVATVKNLEGVRITPIEKWDAIYATWK